VPPWLRRRSGIDSAKAWSMAAEPTLALGSRPTRNSISRKSSTRSRQASQRRRWSRAHSRSLPSSRSSSTALGEMRVQRFRSKLDVVIDLPQFGTATVQGVHQLARGHVDHISDLVVGELHEIAEQDERARLKGESGECSLDGVAPQRAPRFRLGEVIQVDLGGALAPKPAARPQHRTAELGGHAKDVGPPKSLVVRALAKTIGNLAEGGAGDRGGAIDVIDEPGHVVQNEGEVRVELAFHGRRPRAEGWRFDVYLIHYWDGERMPAV